MLAFWPQLYRTSNRIDYVYNDDGTIAVNDNGDPIYSSSDISPEKWIDW